MKRVEVKLHPFLVLLLGGGEWSGSCFDHLTPRGGVFSTRRVGNWVCAGGGLDVVVVVVMVMVVVRGIPACGQS
jgi:hypothetical protein